jgi:hypothetical protein
MNHKQQIESTPALTELVRIARLTARTEGEVMAAVNQARRRNPDLAAEAMRELARLNAAVESTWNGWNDDKQETAADAA